MPDNVKMMIVEKNGTELTFHEEKEFIPSEMPFSNIEYSADNVEDAIIETATQGGQSRYVLTSGYESTVQSGRWFEYVRGNSSDTHPFVATEVSEVTSLSASIPSSVTTMTITFYKNGVLAETLVFSSNDEATKVLLTPISLMSGDKWSMQKTSGDNANSVNCYTHIKVAF